MTKQSQTAIDQDFMSMAEGITSESDDPHIELGLSEGVGCLIVKDNLVISKSANILPTKLSHKKIRVKPFTEERYQYIEHAERSAIFKALMDNHNTTNSTLYCTRFPCSDCARAIIASGISRVVTNSGFGEEPDKTTRHIRSWKESQKTALKMLRLSGVTVRYLRSRAS